MNLVGLDISQGITKMHKIHNVLEFKRNEKKYRETLDKMKGGHTENSRNKLNADSTKSANMERNGTGLYSSVDEINMAEEKEDQTLASLDCYIF